MRISLRFVAATLIAASSPALVLAEEASSDAERIGRLEDQVKALEARTPSVRADSSGLSISSPAFSFQFKGLVQLDGRWFTSDSVPQSADTFTFRRIRPTFQGTVGDFIAYRLTPEFAGDSATIVDAYVDLKFSPAATLRAGKVKGPVGLERLQSGGAIVFIERGLPTELAPNREIGLQLQGAVANEMLNYVVGIYNGTTDGADARATDNDGEKEYALRLFLEPVAGLGFGVAGTFGDKEGFAPRAYSTVDRRPGVTFTPGTVYDGDATRISPQGYFYRGPFGLLAEYITSKQELANGGVRGEVTHSAWQVVGSYVLTGDKASYNGVRPASPYHLGKPGWGAVELALRYGELDLDDDTAALGFAPADGVRSMENFGVAVNWYLNNNLKVALNYNQTSFENFSGPDREDERSIFARLQLGF